MGTERRRLGAGHWAGIGLSVLAISFGHYEANLHAVVLHEVFTRLYYLPIVFAALVGGIGAGFGTALFASALYLPHIVVGWHASPAVQVGQYSELVVFVLMGVVSGQVSARFRKERDRAQAASAQREEALRRLQASVDERLQVDRLVTTGQLAMGVAHELRNPLAAASGALEILGRGTILPERRDEFLGIARCGIDRASTLIHDLLEFAWPSPPAGLVVDLRGLVRQACRLTSGTLAARDVSLDVVVPDDPVNVSVDVGQMQRALVTLLLEIPLAIDTRQLHLAVYEAADQVAITIHAERPDARPDRIDSLFEPFTDPRVGHGLTLALAKRLVENQGGTLEAAPCTGGVRVVLSFQAGSGSLPERAVPGARFSHPRVIGHEACAARDSVA